jgi:catechol 2,3-dioxygenase-like lactoylglutathione lyase family enzyme
MRSERRRRGGAKNQASRHGWQAGRLAARASPRLALRRPTRDEAIDPHATSRDNREGAMAEVIGIDHIYLTVRDLAASRAFYDRVMKILGFRSGSFAIDGDPHASWYNRHFGFVLRPARRDVPHDSYAPGLHHFCLRVDGADDVRAVASALREAGVPASEPRLYPEYAPDYFATFFEDPDGIRLEVTNYRQERRQRHDRWEELAK